MHVAIDAHMIGERETGNERYTLNLITKLAQVDTENQYSLLVTEPAYLKSALGTLPKNFACLPVWPATNLLRVAWAMPRTCHRIGAAVLHISYTAPPICPCATVVTVHDIAYEFFPEFFSLRDRLLLSHTVPFSCRRASRIIAVSEQTKQDLIQRYGLSSEKIRVVYEAAEERFSPEISTEDMTRVRRKYADGQHYILALGNIQPRKNLDRLVDAFATLVADGVIGNDLSLVIAGQSQWHGSDIYQHVERKGLAKHVHFPGYMPDEDLPALYRGAEVFVFPSLYEGFGLPPLEAMACGTPVICSNASSLPEVVGGAAILFDPTDTDALAQALHHVLVDEPRRRELALAGLERASLFSWEKAARETVEVYAEAAQT